MPALRLSYLNLPVKLRQCFAFCALFPKDEIISKRFLIELWMANGFISSNDILDEEDIGNEVWNELYWRSFFQDIEIDIFGKITSFKMHDLVHDLAQSISEEVCCITDNDGMPSMSERIRHISFDMKSLFREVDSIRLRSVKSLKTYTTQWFGEDKFLPHVLEFHSLRVLDAKHITKEVPMAMGHLIYLRYLNLSNSYFETLPESICKLRNLQTLKLDYCVSLQKLPNNFILLKALQHLSFVDCFLLRLPPQIGKLTSLKTLSKYVVGEEKGYFLAELGQLNLKGELHIENLDRVRSVEDAKEANMLCKHLTHLRLSWDRWLSWDRFFEDQLKENYNQILEVLQPYTQQLQKLHLNGYKGSCFPRWMSSPSLKDLRILYLANCKNCIQLPQLVKLPSLKELTLHNMSQVIYVEEESYNGGFVGCFIGLKKLSMMNLRNLTRLSKDDKENMFPHLSKLEIIDCPNLVGLTCLPSLNDMYIQGKCNKDLLRSIHKFGSLESLSFDGGYTETCFPDEMLRNLTSLKSLMIQNYSQIEGLDEALQHATSLRSLSLEDLRNLTSLSESLGNLSSLHELRISNCPELKCLPMSIQSLTGLNLLHCYGCSDQLVKRCEKETGEDWPKISHIQHVEVWN